MRTLTLVRHAKSSWRFALDDRARPLNRRGLRDVQRIPPIMRRQVPAPDLVLCSDAARAVQTCLAIADSYDLPQRHVRFEERLYMAGRDELLELIGETEPTVSHLLVVGHNPGLTALYNHLCAEYEDNLATFAVVVLEIQGDDWRHLGEHCAARRMFITPKTL